MSEQPRIPGATEGQEGTPPPKKRSRARVLLRWLRRTGMGTLLLLSVILVALLSGLALLTQTSRGQRAALDFGLNWLQPSLAGTLSVEGIHSGGLLGGAMLVGVQLDAEGGHPFLTVDSIQLRYSPWSLLMGRPSLSSATAWGASVEISTYAPDQPLNVTRLLVPGPPGADSAAAPTEFGLGRVRLVGALVEVLTPQDPGATGPSVPSPTGEGRLGRLALEDVSLEIDDAAVRLGGAELFRGFLAAFSADIYVVEEPLVVTGAEGRVSFGSGGLAVENGSYTLPGTRARGDLALGPRATEGQAWAFSAELDTEGPGDLADFRWVDPRVPDGTVRGGLELIAAGGAIDLDLRDVLVELEASRLMLSGGVTLEDGFLLDGMEVRASPVVLARLEPWLDRALPVDGFISGRAVLSGSVEAMAMEGSLTLAPTGHMGRPTTAEFRGMLHGGDDPGASDFVLRLEPLNYGLLNIVRPGLAEPARGWLTAEADGRVSSGVRFTAELDHRPDQGGLSHLTASGVVSRTRAGAWVTDVEGELMPLSLDLLARAVPDAGLFGETRGTVNAVGPITDLEVGADLYVGGGRALVDGRLNALDPASRYRLDVRLEDVSVETVATAVPQRSLLTGTLLVEGSGATLAGLDVTADLMSGSSRIGGLHLDTAWVSLRTADGLLTVDTLEAALGGVRVAGVGTLGLIGARDGQGRIVFETDSLVGLRSIFMGDTVMAADTLTELERQVLVGEGIDVSALPDTADVAMSGSAHGDVEFGGSIEALDLDGRITLREARYGPNLVDSASFTFSAVGIPSAAGTLDGTLDASGLTVGGRVFRQVHATVSMSDRAGSATLDATLRETERVVASGDFAFDSVWAGEATVREAHAELDTLRYDLVRPVHVAWDSLSVEVDDLEIRRPGEDPMRLTASGHLARAGESDFDLVAEGVHLEQVARLAQLVDMDVSGHVDATLRVTGPASAPLIDGSVLVYDARYGTVALDSVNGTVAYAARSAEIDLEAWNRNRRVFRAAGQVPVNLALDGREGAANPGGSMDLTVVADSLDAAIVTGYLTFIEDVTGSVSGDFRIGGTLDAPEPSGVLSIENAAYTIEAIGVRHRSVNGTLRLDPAGTVTVDLSTSATGVSTVTGTVTLDPLVNPSLDLALSFRGFQAVQRADVEGRISGDLDLTGTYERPFMTGALTVDQGTLFLEEFARNAEIVDLTDPRLFELAVDTAALSARPLLAEIQNPFLDHLRMDVALSVPRDAWLRSSDMNVEMGGSLQVSYDRAARDIVMVGELEALRGSYTVLGRNFEVRSGTVGFIGTSGINPTLNIEALARVRRAENRAEPLEVTANVTGTLTQPRVSLSTPNAGVAESDLVSYLVFGRPTAELASSQDAAIQGAAGSLVGGVAGTLVTQLGALVAQGVGVDYLSVTQAGDFNPQQGGASFRGTQIELGQYLGESVFIVLVLRPLDQPFLAGARAEVALSDLYSVEAFIESRFLRSALASFQDITQDRVVGVFVFREWAY